MERFAHQATTKDGVRISFDLCRWDNRDEVLIICPGFFQSKETAAFQHLAKDLATDQDVLCMDFCGHGRSSGLAQELVKAGEGLANYKRPVGFEIWEGEELPKTATRKIKRLDVRQWLQERPAASGTSLRAPQIPQKISS